ncbi:MAG: group I intron-associated PD-(D/E)XK endonuclease [Terriglobales bacterium]
MENSASTFKTHKARGEWVELCFMAKAAGKGLSVSKPFGDSASYDVGVESKGRILRVQIKSTTCQRPGTPYYALRLVGSHERRYAKGELEFVAAYLIPIDAWYILPFEEVEGRSALHFTPGGSWEKYKKYREAWDLLRG